MESLGNYLKTQRESQELSLKQVSESTKIREPLLKALEEDRYDLISSPVYVKGFLDAYARSLGLDPEDVIRQYQDNYENKTPPKGPELKQRTPSPGLNRWSAFAKRRVTRWHLIIAISAMVLLIAILAYLISQKFRHRSLPLSKKGSALAPVPFVPPPPPIREEDNTRATNPPEKVETPERIGSQKTLSTNHPGQRRATKEE